MLEQKYLTGLIKWNRKKRKATDPIKNTKVNATWRNMVTYDQYQCITT